MASPPQRSASDQTDSHPASSPSLAHSSPRENFSSAPPDAAATVVRALSAGAGAILDFPGDRPLHELIWRQIDRRSGATALVCGAERLTYAELGRAAHAVALRLLAAGLRPEDRVALLVERGPGMVVALLGILEAGGVYVPIDPRHPQERIAYLLADCDPALLVTQRALLPALPAGNVPFIVLDDPAPAPARELPITPATQLAYIIYTSGSTGRPKGVMIEHRSLVNCLWSLAQEPGLDADDVLLAVTTLSFDIAGVELLLPLLSGARVVIARSDEAADGTALRQLIEHHGVTVMQATPATWRLLLEAGFQRNDRLRALSGGEALPADLARRLLPLVASLWNLYGPTETTIWSSLTRLDADLPPGYARLGRPIANTRIYVLDGRGEPAAAGASGEICIGGEGVARGYWRRKDLTSERFVPDPFVEGARMYRTGDMGRWGEDHALEYLGRMDAQIKLRGFRVEPGEIEFCLTQCASVREAAVVAREDAAGDQRLVAYLTSSDPAACAPRLLRAQLGRSLPDYMLPSAFVILERLPLTTNGKLDRKALPAPGQDASAGSDFEPPAAGIETAIADAWQEILRVPSVGRGDDFFDLGGHSLLCMQLIGRLRNRLGVELTPAALFAAPVLRDLAQAVRAAQRTARSAILPRTRTGPVPLSWPQERLWIVEQFNPAAAAAHVLGCAWRITGALDREALRWAFDRLWARHDALRTQFIVEDGRPLQRVRSPEEAPFLLRERDLRGAADIAAELTSCCEEILRRPFDLGDEALIRAQVFRVADDAHVLLIGQHHIVSDAWSIGNLVEELSALYEARMAGRADPLDPLTIQYADYALWQRQQQPPPVLEPSLQFWKEYLADAPPLLELPTDRPRPEQQSFSGAAVPVSIPESLGASLRALSERRGTTLFMTLLAGWATLLSRVSAQPDLVIGVPVANRGSPELEPLLGFFVNALPMRVRLHDDPTVAEVLRRIRSDSLRAFEHQELPFALLVEELRPPRSLGHSPVFQVMFTLDNAPGERSLRLDRLACEEQPLPRSGAQFDLVLSLRDDGRRLDGSLDYASDLFDEGSIRRLGCQLLQVLAAMAADDSQRVSRLPLLSETERREILEDWNATAADFPAGSLNDFLERAMVAHADATAVRDGTRELTYRELDAAATHWAARLQQYQVVRGSVVGVALPRSLETVVVALGILKAGGVYLPLDTAYPFARLNLLLQDAGAIAVVTNSGIGPGLDAALAQLRIEAAADPPPPRAVRVSAEDAAYIIYTSGSTGTPKGVSVSHGSAVNLHFARTRGHDPIGPGDRVLAAISVGFDVSVGQLVLPLLTGACIVIAPDLREISGDDYWSLVISERVTHVNSVPSFFETILDAAARHPGIALRRLMLGGEQLSSALCRRLHELLPETEIYNMYGPTETCIDATAWRVPDIIDATAPAAMPIGRPLANYRVYVLDDNREPVPVGVPGELYIGGAGVALGYAGQPELTADRFLPDPFGPSGSRVYRTGDLVFWRPDGNLAFVRRRDSQIKIRGMRVEPGEIEAALGTHPRVARAAVVPQGSPPALVAYLVTRGELAQTELRAHLARRLPAHMMPAAFVYLDALPLNANGKLDRRALPKPDPRVLQGASYEAPVGELETRLCAIWERTLRIERVGRHGHFFELGGHSLAALQALSAIRQECQTSIPLTWLFQGPTPAQLAALIGPLLAQAPAHAPRWRHLLPLNPGGARAPVYCLNGADGHVEDYLHLARLIDASVPVYGLEMQIGSNGESGSAVHHLEAYREEIRAFQPTGPYRICGFSFGGSEAFELSCQLAEQGQDVLLILIDAYRPSRWLTAIGLWQRTQQMLRSGRVLAILRRKVREFSRLAYGRLRNEQPPTLRQTLLRQAGRRKYRPFHGRALLIKADGDNGWGNTLELDGANGWRKLMQGGFEVTSTPGNHSDLMKEPAVRGLAEHLNRILTG